MISIVTSFHHYQFFSQIFNDRYFFLTLMCNICIPYPGSASLSSSVSAGVDLALLSLCNHLVLSRGTFGAWASFLSGAARILPKHFTPGQGLADPFALKHQVPLFDMSQR